MQTIGATYMDSYKSLSVLLLSLLLIFLATTVTFAGFFDGSDEEKAWFCTNATSSCQLKHIEQTYSSCKHSYNYGNVNRTSSICNLSDNGPDNISLIADAANHIDSDMTNMEYDTEVFYPGIRKQWDLEFINSSSALVTSESGRLYKWKPNEGSVKIGVFDSIDPGLNGLQGLTLHPEFERNNRVYVQFTSGLNQEFNKESRFDDSVYMNQKVIKFNLLNNSVNNRSLIIKVPSGKHIPAGRPAFGPAGYLYIPTSAASPYATTQNVSTLDGKVIRLLPNGEIPDENPNQTASYARGFKNVQGMDWHPETDRLWASQHGPWRQDEINQVKPGQNYGWPDVSCGDDNSESERLMSDSYEEPEFCAKDWTLAPSGIEFVDDKKSPLYGDLLVAGLRSNHLHRFQIEQGKIISDEIFYFNNQPIGSSRRMRDVEYINGSLWILMDQRGIVKLSNIRNQNPVESPVQSKFDSELQKVKNLFERIQFD